ncbi:MAG: ferredoxin family 2Fe-2S iron-sulfur cluster binding protein [Alphaproteobacteria bacterium]|nr:ferredoxin family 2Fe-2S iron-sulfur cluster binding protein [Alphaproteobacteria bacterium]
MVKVTFKKNGLDDITADVPEGTTILEAAHSNGADLEGSCEGSLACSTCHVILEQNYYDKLEEPSDDENDMLDMAFGLSKTSRLGCQVKITKDLEGAILTIPSKTRNVQS